MPKRMKVERSPNYSYYSDILSGARSRWSGCHVIFTVCARCCFLAALWDRFHPVTAWLAPLHGTGYQSHEPSSECFAALIALLMPASISYPIVISAVIVAVLVGEARR